MQSNLEKSEVVIATILKLLLDKGLQGSMLSFKSLDLPGEYEPFFKTCFLWLVFEGLVRSSNNIESINSAFHAYDPVLTAKGFSTLGHDIFINGNKEALATAVESISRSKVD